MNFQVHILPDPINLILQLVATLILFLVIRSKVTAPLKEMLDKRARSIEEDIKVAKNQKTKAEELKTKYEISLEKAKEEGREIVESAKKRGDQLKDEIISEAKTEANVEKNRAKNEIEREKERALDSLKSEVASMVMLVANKVVNKNLDEATHKDMIDNFISEVGESKWQS